MRWLLLLAVGLVACADDSRDLASLGTLERDRIELVAEADEALVERPVREGDHVEAGALLVRLDAGRVAAQAERARSTRDEIAARLAELRRGPRAERIAEARAVLAGAEGTLTTALRELERARALAQADYASRSRLDQALTSHDAALSARDAARARLLALETGATAEELAAGESALAAAEAALADAALRLARLELRAPRAGIVDALPFELGERPPPGAVLAVLLADGPPWARVHVPEPVRVKLRAGVRARVRIDGFDEPFEGRLRSIANEAAFTPYFALTQRDRSRLSYLAEVDVTSPGAAELPTGVPVEVTFDLGTPAREVTTASEARSEPEASAVTRTGPP
jgi:HlyD family secretion protein